MSDEPTPEKTPEATVKSLSGFDEGAVLESGEIVKGTYDDNHNLIGWHKEAPTEGTK